MKKNILKYFYIYLIVFLIFGLAFIMITEIFLNKKIKYEIKNIQNIVIINKKKELKKQLENVKYIFEFIKDSIYSTNTEEFLKFVNIPIREDIKRLIVDKNFLYGLVDRKIEYSVKNNYIFANFNNRKYLVVLKNVGKKIYIFGVNKKFLDDIVIFNFLKFLNKYNKNQISYIAIGKVTNLNPGKNGTFGYVFYMPQKLKYLEGKLLSINTPDVKGLYYRKEYFKCFKQNTPCFIKYHFKNPKTGEVEEKISYFDFIKDYNFILLKGIYASQIRNFINKEINARISYIKSLVYAFLFIFFILYIGFLILLYLVLNKTKENLLKEYFKLEDELIKRVYYDKLTNLPNRNKLLEDINQAEALVLMDIDNFTQINDIYGFEAGDEILKITAYILKRKYQNVYRVGSDEFIILFDKKIDKKLLDEISSLEITYDDIYISFVMGASNYKQRLLESCELALKEAYIYGTKYKLYDTHMLDIQKNRLSKIRKLREVLRKGDVIPYYQCIVDKYGHIIKYEALMRIKIDNKIKSPHFFMDLIKEAKLYIPFSKIMLKKVFDNLEKIDKKVTINLSFEDIANIEMKNYILNLINEKNANKIIFEILESESVKDYKLIKKFIDDVKNKGVEIAIDDFGSGYSNFVKIMKLNPDIIKIDESLIKALYEEKNYKLVELIVKFAKEFNLKVVAEFVSDEKKYNVLKNMGLDQFQGYYFCKPEPLVKIIIN